MAVRLLGFTATMLTKLLVFKTTGELGSRRLEQGKLKYHTLVILTELQPFFFNSPQVFASFCLISRVLKKLVLTILATVTFVKERV